MTDYLKTNDRSSCACGDHGPRDSKAESTTKTHKYKQRGGRQAQPKPNFQSCAVTQTTHWIGCEYSTCGTRGVCTCSTVFANALAAMYMSKSVMRVAPQAIAASPTPGNIYALFPCGRQIEGRGAGTEGEGRCRVQAAGFIT